MRAVVALCLACLACTSQPEPPKPVAAAPPSTAAFTVEPPTRWSRDIRASESAADAASKQVARPLCDALRREQAAGVRAVLTSGFRGQIWGAGERVPSDSTLIRQRHPVAPEPLRGRAFADALFEARAAFTRMDRCSLGVHAFKLAEPSGDRAYAQAAMEVAGRGRDGAPLLWRAQWTLALVRYGDTWRLDRAQPTPLDSIVTRARPFVDVSGAVGIGLHRSADATRAMQSLADDMDIETIGGLGAIDFDRDGFNDLLVWNRRRALWLFRNDGRGGFEARADLIPPEQVGLHHLYADLDGDGQEELVSTAVLGCANGVARLPLFKRRGDAFVPGPPLEFPMTCVDPDGARYQHIAVADVNADGRADLIVSGFSNHYTRQANFNHFDSHNGLRNLLFINQGGLRFVEDGEARGLTGTRFTYVATAFDHDDDGDPDLYFANDFGANALFINDGAGRFTQVTQGALTENGQSMGLTVADFDGDLRLDVYVSNMYSKAGKRIVPLAQGLKPETLKTLAGLAAGNTLYRRGASGWESAADRVGVARAGWAWGQAFFDADNDGDRDLYVVNGMSSHSAKAAPDF